MKKSITLLVLLSFQLAFGVLEAWSSSTSSPGTPASGAQQPVAPSAPPAGITNGTLAIESTILAYKVLVANAAQIDQSLNTKTKGKFVIVGMSTDIAAIVQLRIVLGQAGILKQRLETAATALRGFNKPAYVHPPRKGPVKLGAGFIASPADVATLIQTLGSITAVNETLSSTSGALNDATLIGLVARGIQSASVYIPSVYPPHLITNSDLSHTLLGDAMSQLETARRDAIAESNGYRQALQDAQIVATTVKGGRDSVYTDSEIDAAGEFAEKATSIDAFVNAVTMASSAVDGFEASLFTGQGYSPNTGQPNNPAPAPSTPPAAPAFPAPVPAPPLAPVPAPTNPQSQGQGQQPATPSGTTLQQILSADLLLHEFVSNPANLSKLQLLSVHALESGGGQLTKSNLFLGSRIYFSGGAVASFSLFDGDGTLECSGVGYGYKGYIREKDIESMVGDATPAATTVSTDCK